ncbi:hypothetical protein B7486_47540 [cyanobacterium TDX16]|nr:hypothetical protein B7486_47540 [cyanobacterium TDX16]
MVEEDTANGIANLLCWQGKILLVFYTDYNRWQFRLLSEEGKVFGEQQTYKTAIDAERAGRKWVAGCKGDVEGGMLFDHAPQTRSEHRG